MRTVASICMLYAICLVLYLYKYTIRDRYAFDLIKNCRINCLLFCVFCNHETEIQYILFSYLLMPQVFDYADTILTLIRIQYTHRHTDDFAMVSVQ